MAVSRPRPNTATLREYIQGELKKINGAGGWRNKAKKCFEETLDLLAILDNYTENEVHMIDLLDIQGERGNWDSDQYMLGMYNGMELMAATMQNREPEYRNLMHKHKEKCQTSRPGYITDAEAIETLETMDREILAGDNDQRSRRALRIAIMKMHDYARLMKNLRAVVLEATMKEDKYLPTYARGGIVSPEFIRDNDTFKREYLGVFAQPIRRINRATGEELTPQDFKEYSWIKTTTYKDAAAGLEVFIKGMKLTPHPEAREKIDAELLDREEKDDYRPRHEIVVNDFGIFQLQEKGTCPQLMAEIKAQFEARASEPQTEEQRQANLNKPKVYRISETAWKEYLQQMPQHPAEDPAKKEE